ncbi:MAG: glycosyltransferase family 39 protein [Candidatus Eisenbacteria bacterium]
MRSSPEHAGPRGVDPVLALILGTALLLRLHEAMRAPLWYDELYSWGASHRPFLEMLAIARADVHPPLHFVLTWCWGWFGDSDLAIRSLSIVCGLGGLAAAHALTQAMFGRSTARIATLLLALHPWHIYISQEARSYALLWLALTLSALGAWHWSERGRSRDATLFVLASAVALWTHYIAGPVLVVQFAWGIAALARHPGKLARWFGLHLMVALLFAPQLHTLRAQFHRVETDHWLQRPDQAALSDVGRRLAFGSVWFLPGILGFAFAPLLRTRTRRAAVFGWTVGIVTVLACWYLSTRGVRLFGVKYMLFALPLVMALVAAGVMLLPGRAPRWVVIALLASGALRSTWLRAPQPEAESLALVRSHLASRARAGDLVFHADTHTLLFSQHYLPNLRHRLLIGGQRLPYFEGGLLVAESTRAVPDELAAAHVLGSRWFALAARPAGIDTRAARAQFDSLAFARNSNLGVVTVWDGVRP